jgi:hypothetical protein
MANQKPGKKVDPNRYSKNIDIQAESKMGTLAAVVRMGLMLIGIVGLAMELFRDDGWLKKGLAKLFESTTSMMFIPVIIFVLWLLNRWMSSGNKGETRKSGELPMYAMMAAGAYYLFMLVTTGGF